MFSAHTIVRSPFTTTRGPHAKKSRFCKLVETSTNSADALFLRDDHDEEGNALANRRRDGGSKGGDTGARAGRQT